MWRTLVSVAAKVALVAWIGAVSTPNAAAAQNARSYLEQAARSVESHQYDDAEDALQRAVDLGDGPTLREALFRLAGLKRSVDEARALYERVIDDDPSDEWSSRSRLELAKIQYALGDYSSAFNLLSDGEACELSDEACLFHGLSAVMLKRYNDAREPLSRVRRGRLRTWAYISLAEADMGLDRREDACGRYESLASALISPTALYRYGECLEDRGDADGAKRTYRSIISNFRDTPEAVLAAEKLQAIDRPQERPEAPSAAGAVETEALAVLETGFTLQFGSFRDRGNAIKLAAKLKRMYPGVRIDSELVRYREHYRVRYGYFRTREEAQAKGDEIARETNESYTIMTLP